MSAQFLRTVLGTLSGPEALCVWIFRRSLATPAVLIFIDGQFGTVWLVGGATKDL